MMIKRSSLILLVVVAIIAHSCKTDDYKETKTGLKYKIHVDQEGKTAEKGDIIKLHLITKTNNDSVLSSTYEREGPVQVRVGEPAFEGDMMEGLTMLSEGDSATFKVSVDSMFTAQNRPPFVDSGSYLKYDVKMIEILTEEEFMQQRQEEMKDRMSEDVREIQSYIQEKGFDAERSPTGVFYVIEKEGTGKQIEQGSKVKVHYKGYFFNGEAFDSSYNREPFELTVGQGQVIQGWDQGLIHFSEGAEGKLIIPSSLGYGSQQRGPIPANSNLVFDIKVLEVN